MQTDRRRQKEEERDTEDPYEDTQGYQVPGSHGAAVAHTHTKKQAKKGHKQQMGATG